jgi:hypothetical protein
MKDDTNKTDSETRIARRDLSQGAIAVLSGGPFDFTNPPEVRNRMDQLILDVNADPYVLANTGGQGLKFKLIPNQECNHIHQSRWPDVCDSLKNLKASPLILIGHSNGGAAVIDIARCLQNQGIFVDLAFTADSVFTLNDDGDVNKVPSNVKLNLNPYVIPTPYWPLLPFPFGQQDRREADNSLDGILNIGLPYPEPGAIAHRDAFYDLAGGDLQASGAYKYPEMILQTTLAVLRGAGNDEIFQLAQTDLQMLANEVLIDIDVETTNFKTTLIPVSADGSRISVPRLTEATTQEMRGQMNSVEKLRLSAVLNSSPVSDT